MKRNIHRALTIGAVVAGVGAAGRSVQAQSSDAIINKLVEKGILSGQEAADIRKEADHDFAKTYGTQTGAPSWVSKFNFHGDFRGRLDYLSSDNAAFTDRYRLRYRLRAGADVMLKDDFLVGFMLGSGDAGGNPLSNNTTLENNGSKKPIWIDTAFAKWTPIHDEDWTASATIGKMINPFRTTPMEFDPDYTPEGLALQGGYKFNDNQSIKLNGAAFVLDELAASSHDPFLLGGQIIWDANWNKRIESSLGISMYGIGGEDGLATGNIPNNNGGNTRDANGNLLNHYNPIVSSGSITYKLDHFPLYPGAFPIRLAGEYMNNPAADDNNTGWWGGIMLGKSGEKGAWGISYRYQRLEADAWLEELVDDDNVAYFRSAGASDKSGLVGGTNIKGHLLKVNYSVLDSLTFTFSAYFNDLINPSPSGSKSGGTHVMADVMWKF